MNIRFHTKSNPSNPDVIEWRVKVTAMGAGAVSRSNQCAHKGFALIATISVMVLLVMIALAMLSLSTIELRSSRNDQAMAEARANARLALMMAIGELQKNLGPDQRVNANASLYLTEQTNRSQWMGVYKSWTADQNDRPEPEFIRWMVSGNSQMFTDKGAYATGNVADSMVKLVGNGTLGSSLGAQYHVEAGRIALDDRHTIAWWVGDETSKARVSPPTPMANSAVKSRSQMMASPRVGLERLDSFAAIEPDDERLDKVMTLPTLDLIAQNGSNENPHFHDLTVSSSITMTNVRDGGLRKDLSMHMARPIPASAAPEPLYSVQGQPGITMRELWTYYNLWEQVEYPTAPINHPDGGNIPANTPSLTSNEGPRDIVKDPYFSYKRLTIIRASWVVSHMSRLEENPQTGKQEYQLYMVLDPILTIWNPFDVAVNLGPKAYQGFRFWGIPYDTDITKNGALNTYKINDIIGNFVMAPRYGWDEDGLVDVDDDIVLRPGEVLVISQGSRDETVVRSTLSTDIRLGWEFGAGFRFPVKGFTGPATTRLTHKYRPRPDGHFGFGLTEFLHTQGDSLTSPSSWIGGLMIDRKGGASRVPLQATDSPKLFPEIVSQPGASYTLGDIRDKKRPAMIYSLDMKMETDPLEDGRFQGKFRLRHNPKLPSYDLQSFDDQTIATTPMQVSVKGVNSWKDAIVNITSAGQGYAGGGYTAENGNSYIVTHSIPREPIHSIAAFQHALGNGVLRQAFEGSGKEPANNYFLQPSISHAVGNSFAPSFLAGDATEGRLNNSPAADHSYLANQALWDSWFFSSIAPQTSKSWKKSGQTRTQKQVFEDFVSGEEALPIRHFKPWVKDEASVLNDLFAADEVSEFAAQNSARHLMLDGGFNVNSTSVDAWKLLLSGLRNTAVAKSDPRISSLEVLEVLEESEGTLVAGLLTPFGEAINDNDLNDPKTQQQWNGYRDLTDDQIDELAEAIVRQVRARGPFLSLADFVNRRLEESGDASLSGTLQAALDDEGVSINKPFRTGNRNITEAQATAAGLSNAAAEAGASAAGIPGYVKQADLLTSIGAYLTPRSDTYRIRAYGETLSADGSRVIAKAWCEAIVQRVPDYIDTQDSAEKKYDELTQAVNQRFGRRMNMVSFRWLGSQDI